MKLARHVGVLIILGAALFAGLRGLDFGEHWDESKFLDHGVLSRISKDSILPGVYYYGAVSYNIAYLSLVPEFFRFYRGGYDRLPKGATEERLKMFKAYLLETTKGKDFNLRVRSVFLWLSLLSVVWIYLAVYLLRGRLGEALLAASLLGFSWEVNYHARWIAPDALMMQFGSLTLLFLVLSRTGQRKKLWITAAAIAGGLAFSTKYPAGLLLIPCLIGAWLVYKRSDEPLGIPWQGVLANGSVFFATFFLVNPGAIFEPLRFIDNIAFNMIHYRGHHCGYSIGAGVPHLLSILEYFTVALFSAYLPLAVGFFLLAAIGIYGLIRDDRRLAWVLLSFPLLYTIYFSVQKVMIVRNLLILAPFLAFFAARGFGVLVHLLMARGRYYYLGASAVVALAVAVNLFWMVKAGNSIHDRNYGAMVKELGDYIKKHPATQFTLSPKVLRDLQTTSQETLPDNIVAPAIPVSQGTRLAVLSMQELRPKHQDRCRFLPANRNGYYTLLGSGPWDVNFDYYPSFLSDRIFMMPWELGRRISLFKP